MINDNFNRCRDCGRHMNPVDALVGGALDNAEGPICGKCVRVKAQEDYCECAICGRRFHYREGSPSHPDGPMCRSCLDIEYDQAFPDTPLAEILDDNPVAGIDY